MVLMTIFQRILGLKNKPSGLNKTDYAFIFVGLAIFMAISFWTITKSSIWFDEAFGAYMIHFNFLEIAWYTAVDVHPPLYYWLLKIWSMIFGNTELALRSMSVFFGAIAVLFGYLLTHRLFGKNIARTSLIFMVLSPMIVRYSQEMRMYTLVAAIVVVATYVLTFAINSKKRLPWVVYGVLVSLGMWTHYFSALIWISHWIWRADIVRRSVRKTKFIKTFFSREWILAHLVAVGVFAAWVPCVLTQATIVQVGGFWIPAVTPDTFVNFYTNLMYYQTSSETVGWLAFGVFAVISFLAWLAVRVYKDQNDTERQSYRLIMIMAFVPVLLLFILSLPPLRSSFVDRYLIPSTFFTYLFIGLTMAYGVKFLNKRLHYISLVFMAGVMVIGILNVWHFGNYAKNSNPPASNNARQIVAEIVKNSGDNQPIIADSPWLFYEAVSYSTDKHPIYFIDANTEYIYGSLEMLKGNSDYTKKHKIQDMDSFTNNNSIVWYVGLPRGADYNAPYDDWKELQRVAVDDSINGKPAYVAIQYQVDFK